jgi:hypothetical protein
VRRALAAFGVALIAVGCTSANIGPGPLRGGGVWVSIPVRRAEFAVTSIPLRVPKTGSPIVLQRAEPEHPQQTRFARIRFAASRGYALSIGAARAGSRGAWDLRPLHGFSVPAGSHAAVVVGVASERRGTIFVRSLAIEERIGHDRYRAVYPAAINVCVGQARCRLAP